MITGRHLGAGAAALAILSLLAAFQYVVRLSASQGEMRRAAATALQEADGRCDVLNSRQARADCRAELARDVRDGATLGRSSFKEASR